VRVEQPEALAAFVLRDVPEWTAERIRDAMYAGTERSVALPQPIPVHLVYFTAWISGEGVATYAKDIYGHDRRHVTALTRR
jgi:murein L,D-transpeptidase YcbB/YkuD